jgi:putative FmdB family regulatory protein
MPLYEYDCPQHGVFEAMRGLSEYSEPAPCPECSVRASRVLSLPRVSSMARSEVVARDRNERSAHEPRVARRSGDEHARHHRCRGSENHGKPAPLSTKPQLKAYKGSRPWVIEHG